MKIEILLKDQKISEENIVRIKLNFNSECKKNRYFKIIDNSLKKIIFIEVPKVEKYTENFVKKLGNDILRFLKDEEFEEYFLDLSNLEIEDKEIYTLIESIYIGNYEFNKYKSGKLEDNKILYLYTDKSFINKIDEIKKTEEMISITKDLINTPSNDLYPETFAEYVKDMGIKYGFEVEILGKDEIKKLGMGAFEAVGKGSTKESKLIVARYIGNKSDKNILGFVGKGITYDSGGYSIKSTPSMLNMKNDMGGAATLVGVLCRVAKEKLNKNIVVVIAACENLISGNSYKPGDVIKTMSGLTVEIENTDCEGRMTLADAIYYAIDKEKVKNILTIATLTGGAYNTFGEFITPVFSNDEDYYNLLKQSAEETQEKIWRMPLCRDFGSMINGNIADLKNSSGKVGGLITSALFLEKFNMKNIPWLHLDIAGNVISSSSKMATGVCTKMIYNLIKRSM